MRKIKGLGLRISDPHKIARKSNRDQRKVYRLATEEKIKVWAVVSKITGEITRSFEDVYGLLVYDIYPSREAAEKLVIVSTKVIPLTLHLPKKKKR